MLNQIRTLVSCYLIEKKYYSVVNLSWKARNKFLYIGSLQQKTAALRNRTDLLRLDFCGYLLASSGMNRFISNYYIQFTYYDPVRSVVCDSISSSEGSYSRCLLFSLYCHKLNVHWSAVICRKSNNVNSEKCQSKRLSKSLKCF